MDMNPRRMSNRKLKTFLGIGPVGVNVQYYADKPAPGNVYSRRDAMMINKWRVASVSGQELPAFIVIGTKTLGRRNGESTT